MRIRALYLGLLVVVLFSLGCATTGATKPDTSKLSATGQYEFKADAVIKLINDATQGVIAANRAGLVTDANERVILTVNKQVLDYVTANPASFKDKALEIVRNARQALPPSVDSGIAVYLQKTIDALLEAQ